MKRLLICLLLFITPALAEELTILNNIKNSKVYLNGVYIGNETISNHLVEPGNYIVQIKVDGETSFKQSFVVKQNENKVIDSTLFVGLEKKSTIINYQAKQVEEKRVKKSVRGNIGVGGMFNWVNSGISVKFHPIERLGIQGIGWAHSSDDSDKYNVVGRIYYELQDTLLNIDKIAVVYIGAGMGKVNESNDDPVTGLLTGTKTDTKDLIECFIGMDFSLGNNFFINLEFSLIKSDNETVSFAGVSTSDTSYDTMISLGGHLYFN